MNRVAVTGLGVICGLGHNTNEVWKNLLEGKSGVSTIDHPDFADIPVKIAGQVKDFKLDESLLSAKEQDRFDRFIHFALHSTKEAMEDAGNPHEHYAPEMMGCILGVGMGGFPFIEKDHKIFLDRGARRVSPFFIPSLIPNMASGLVTMKWNLLGINYTAASACASAAHALASAATEIMLGRQDMVVSGGAESVITPLTYSGFGNMKALSKRNDEPEKASRPFDKDRDGFVMGEGAGILILENYDKAKARGAKIYAEIVGFSASSDAYHITSPHPDGKGAALSMSQALKLSNVSPEQVDYINAHGTSTPMGDELESKAIENVFGEQAYKLNVSSTKSMTGHLLGAAGGIETLFCVKAVQEQIVPPTINLDNQDEQCKLNYTANKAQKREIRYALNNSFGFGGTNASTLIKRVED